MKNPVQKILFPTDFSETAQNAFRHALVLADQWEADIQLLHAVYPEYAPTDLPVMSTKATRDKVSFAESALKSFTEMGITQVQMGYSFQRAPVVQSDVEIGSPVGIINRIADRDSIDLIVMGTKGKHNALERTLGSVTTGVIEGAPCSVLVVPEEAPMNTAKSVAYAADLSETDAFYVWKAGQLLKPFSPIMHIVHVQNGQTTNEYIDIEELKGVFADNVPALQLQFHEIEGDSVTDTLDEFIEMRNIDMLVMFAPHHNLLRRLFHRSNTKKMAMETHVPLLLVKREE